jgi:hypothetical protein
MIFLIKKCIIVGYRVVFTLMKRSKAGFCTPKDAKTKIAREAF